MWNLHQAQDTTKRGTLAVMLTGGGARAAYQVGLIKGIARHFPNVRFEIITGVSAGAINAVFLAARRGSPQQVASDLADMWCELECSSIWQFDWRNLLPFRSALSSVFWRKRWSTPHGIVDTAPLARLLYRVMNARPGHPIQGITENIREGWLQAVALMTLDYTTGQSVRWYQGHSNAPWEGPNRRSVPAELTVEHVMASSALPFLFPAVKIGSDWHGDGGIRLAAPLSPAVHLGATRIIAMSTGYQLGASEEALPEVSGYPPNAQIIGQLLNSIFLDVIDEDVMRLERLNDMVRKLPPAEREGFKPIELLVLRPSVDLGRIATGYQKYLPTNLKLLTRALGAQETDSADMVSMLMFEPHYTQRLVELGESDVDSRVDEIREFLGETLQQAVNL